MKRCPACDTEYSDSTKFCPHDGRVLVDVTQKDLGSDPLINQVLASRYRVIKRLGEGGMGAVYLAENIHAEMQVALKILNRAASKDSVLLKRFEAEKRIISRLRHPNILKLLDSFHTASGELVIVVEYVAGETLEDRVLRRPLSQDETLYVMGEVFDALSEAHDADVVHRDLKPSNLMLERVGDRLMVKVLDFGIAKSLGSTGLTVGGTLGTPAYMSPEQVQGLVLDARSDLYSMGIVAYECLSGSPPFVGENPFSIIRKHIKEAPAPLVERIPTLGINPEVEAYIFQLLAKEPRDRPTDARVARNTANRIRNNLQPGNAGRLQASQPPPDLSLDYARTHGLDQASDSDAQPTVPNKPVSSQPSDSMTRPSAGVMDAVVNGVIQDSVRTVANSGTPETVPGSSDEPSTLPTFGSARGANRRRLMIAGVVLAGIAGGYFLLREPTGKSENEPKNTESVSTAAGSTAGKRGSTKKRIFIGGRPKAKTPPAARAAKPPSDASVDGSSVHSPDASAGTAPSKGVDPSTKPAINVEKPEKASAPKGIAAKGQKPTQTRRKRPVRRSRSGRSRSRARTTGRTRGPPRPAARKRNPKSGKKPASDPRYDDDIFDEF